MSAVTDATMTAISVAQIEALHLIRGREMFVWLNNPFLRKSNANTRYKDWEKSAPRNKIAHFMPERMKKEKEAV